MRRMYDVPPLGGGGAGGGGPRMRNYYPGSQGDLGHKTGSGQYGRLGLGGPRAKGGGRGFFDLPVPRNRRTLGPGERPPSLKGELPKWLQRLDAAWRVFDPVEWLDPDGWAKLPAKTYNPTGHWTQCANPVASCLPSQALTLWDWFGSHATNSGVCNLGACPTNSVSVLGDAIPSMAGWPSTVNLVNIGSPGTIGGRYHHLQQWRRIGPAVPLWTVPRPITPVVPFADPEPDPEPAPQPMKSPAKRGAAKLDEDGRVKAKPSVRPSTDMVFPPARPPRPPVLPDDPVVPPRKPPVKPGEHVDKPDNAKKIRGVPAAMVMALKAMHGLTELGDFVDALYEALPPIARCAGKRGLVHDLICVLEHADAFADPDVMAAAIGNLIANEVEDRVIGALFGSNWRFGGSFRPDNYGGTAWVGGGYGAPQPDSGFGGLISWSGSARMSPM